MITIIRSDTSAGKGRSRDLPSSDSANEKMVYTSTSSSRGAKPSGPNPSVLFHPKKLFKLSLIT